MAVKNIPFFKKLKGFTLTEILVAVLILGIVGGSVLMLGHTPTSSTSSRPTRSLLPRTEPRWSSPTWKKESSTPGRE